MTTVTAKPVRRLPLGRLIVLLVLGWILVLILAFPTNFREYRLHFTTTRPPIAFDVRELSQDWSEADLKRRFKGVRFVCSANETPDNPEERVCFADVGSYNSTPAMFLSFFFLQGRLNRVAINIPWWVHGDAFKSLQARYGRPTSSQLLPVAGIRLHGWSFADGSALFFNRDRPLNPLAWNSLLWQSRRSCTQGGACFNDR